MFGLVGSLCRTARKLCFRGLNHMSAFNAIDLSSLAPPKIIEELSAEKIVDEYVRYFQELVKSGEAGKIAEEYEELALLLPSDPVMKIFEACAYRELLLRQRINEAAKAVMVAYAQGSDLDNLAALVPLERKTAVEGKEVITENDEDFRKRVVLAPEGFSTAGPEGAYIFHALSVEGVKDACPISPKPAEVELYILSGEPYEESDTEESNGEEGSNEPNEGEVSDKPKGKGLPSDALLLKLNEKFNDDIRPFTEKLTIYPATVTEYPVEAKLYVKPGPAEESVVEEAKQNLEAYLEKRYALGVDIPVSGIIAALHIDSVDRVEVIQPDKDIINAGHEAAYHEEELKITSKVVDA